MPTSCAGVRFGVARAARGAIALLLLAAVGLGILPLAVQQPLLPAGERACRFEPIDVCNAGDASLGLLADVPALVPTNVAILAESTAWRTPPETAPPLRDGFAPGIYRPPRPSC